MRNFKRDNYPCRDCWKGLSCMNIREDNLKQILTGKPIYKGLLKMKGGKLIQL